MSGTNNNYSITEIVKGNDFNGLKMTFYNGVGSDKTVMDLTGFSVVIDFKKGNGLNAIFSFKTSNNTITIPTPTNGEIYLQPRKMDYPPFNYMADVNLISPADKLHTYTTINWKICPNV